MSKQRNRNDEAARDPLAAAAAAFQSIQNEVSGAPNDEADPVDFDDNPQLEPLERWSDLPETTDGCPFDGTLVELAWFRGGMIEIKQARYGATRKRIGFSWVVGGCFRENITNATLVHPDKWRRIV